MISYIEEGDIGKVAKLLKVPGVSLSLKGNYWWPLVSATATNNYEMVELLLNGGADPNDGGAIVTAVRHGNIDILKLLHLHGADLKLARSALDIYPQSPAITAYIDVNDPITYSSYSRGHLCAGQPETEP